MMGIILHTNLTVLQNFAHSAPGSAARDAQRCSAAKEVYAWTQDRHYTTARWHAERIIDSLEVALADPLVMMQTQMPSTRTSPLAMEPPRLAFESPHVPYAVYYAALVLWSGTFTVEGRVSSSTSAKAQIARGERILTLHTVHVAKLLARVLSEVK